MTFWTKHKKRLERVFLLGLVLLFPLVIMRQPAVRQALVDLVTLMRESPERGIMLFLVIETFALALTAPVWLMSGLAGYTYGFAKGFVVAWPALITAVTGVFLIGRTFGKKWVTARAAQTHYWKAVNRAVEKDGFKITLLMRLAVALPQNLITYVLSATSIKMRNFVKGSFLGFLPATMVHVYLGSNVDNIAAFVAGESSNHGPMAWITVALGLTLTASALYLASRHARKALDEALAEAARQNG